MSPSAFCLLIFLNIQDIFFYLNSSIKTLLDTFIWVWWGTLTLTLTSEPTVLNIAMFLVFLVIIWIALVKKAVCIEIFAWDFTDAT